MKETNIKMNMLHKTRANEVLFYKLAIFDINYKTLLLELF